MLLRAEEEQELKISALPLLFYMYTPDLRGLREQLLARNIKVPPIRFPGYMPSGEINIQDPDGYHIAIGHWGSAENETWLKRIGRMA